MLAKIAPHAALLVPHCQETYSLTLDELIAQGLAIVTGPYGALPDRVKDWGVGYICDYSVEGVKTKLSSIISEWERHLDMISRTASAPIVSVESEVERFGRMYVELSASCVVDGARLMSWLQPDLVEQRAGVPGAVRDLSAAVSERTRLFLNEYQSA
jgi:hypothetical protein